VKERRGSFILTDMQDESKISSVDIEARYVPVPVKLEPRESINSMLFSPAVGTFLMMYTDQGILRVDLIKGGDLIAADRGGMALHTLIASVG
jgi:Ca2+-dependent lipid-binding protein